MDFVAARANMVDSQIRTNDVTDRRILNAMNELPREAFVPASVRELAYMDEEIALAGAAPGRKGRRLMTPMVFAKLVQIADIGPGDLVLDVGCATGYSTATLARLADAVVGLEMDEGFAEQTTKALTNLGADNAAVVTGPLEEGYASEGPYDVIILNGAASHIPDALFDQLKHGGRLVAVISDTGFGKAHVFKRINKEISNRASFDASAPMLPGFERKPAFVF